MARNRKEKFTIESFQEQYGIKIPNNQINGIVKESLVNNDIKPLSEVQQYTDLKSIKDVAHEYILTKEQLKENKFPNFEKNLNFISLPDQESQHFIISIDCEMVMTSIGKELARISIVNEFNEVLYNKFVKPKNEVLNHLTKYSGITKEDLEYVKTHLEDVQEYLIKNFSKDTIFVGHSLENDLKCLRLIHERVIDTSVLFPNHTHSKFKLKTLTNKYLLTKIQKSKNGHDSIEDAKAAMNLLRYKIENASNE